MPGRWRCGCGSVPRARRPTADRVRRGGARRPPPGRAGRFRYAAPRRPWGSRRRTHRRRIRNPPARRCARRTRRPRWPARPGHGRGFAPRSRRWRSGSPGRRASACRKGGVEQWRGAAQQVAEGIFWWRSSVRVASRNCARNSSTVCSGAVRMRSGRVLAKCPTTCLAARSARFNTGTPRTTSSFWWIRARYSATAAERNRKGDSPRSRIASSSVRSSVSLWRAVRRSPAGRLRVKRAGSRPSRASAK